MIGVGLVEWSIIPLLIGNRPSIETMNMNISLRSGVLMVDTMMWLLFAMLIALMGLVLENQAIAG
jgi:hypothetical protein